MGRCVESRLAGLYEPSLVSYASLLWNYSRKLRCRSRRWSSGINSTIWKRPLPKDKELMGSVIVDCANLTNFCQNVDFRIICPFSKVVGNIKFWSIEGRLKCVDKGPWFVFAERNFEWDVVIFLISELFWICRGCMTRFKLRIVRWFTWRKCFGCASNKECIFCRCWD